MKKLLAVGIALILVFSLCITSFAIEPELDIAIIEEVDATPAEELPIEEPVIVENEEIAQMATVPVAGTPTVTALSSTSARVKWPGNSLIPSYKKSGYRVAMSTTSATTGFKAIKSTRSRQYDVTGLPSGGTVYFKVQAYQKDASGKNTSYSAWSKVVSCKLSSNEWPSFTAGTTIDVHNNITWLSIGMINTGSKNMVIRQNQKYNYILDTQDEWYNRNLVLEDSYGNQISSQTIAPKSQTRVYFGIVGSPTRYTPNSAITLYFSYDGVNYEMIVGAIGPDCKPIP